MSSSSSYTPFSNCADIKNETRSTANLHMKGAEQQTEIEIRVGHRLAQLAVSKIHIPEFPPALQTIL